MNRRMEPVLAVAPRLHCHRRPAPSTQPLPPPFCVLYSPWLARQDPSLPNLTEITRPAAVPGTYVRDTVEPPSPLPRTRADQEAPQASGCKNHPLALSGLRITTPMSVCVCGRWASFGTTRPARRAVPGVYFSAPHPAHSVLPQVLEEVVFLRHAVALVLVPRTAASHDLGLEHLAAGWWRDREP